AEYDCNVYFTCAISNKTLPEELDDELNKAVKHVPKEAEDSSPVLRVISIPLQREVFCQAEQELLKKVSGLSGAKFDHLRFGKKLMRTLNMYNERHKTCKPADEDQDPILLHAFLKNLLTCVKSAYSHVK
uniref:Interleukin 13 n=1 Tax=Sinocyclocheilus anshuiensis TaxID=1608454 RepID=A0A671KV65_9TELE